MHKCKHLIVDNYVDPRNGNLQPQESTPRGAGPNRSGAARPIFDRQKCAGPLPLVISPRSQSLSAESSRQSNWLEEWPLSPTPTTVRMPSAYSTPHLDISFNPSALTLARISHRPRPHRGHRRHWSPRAPRFHTGSLAIPLNALGRALLANHHPAPPMQAQQPDRRRRIPKPPRPAPPARPARGPSPRERRRPALHRRAQHHRLLGRRQSPGGDQAARLCRAGPDH